MSAVLNEISTIQEVAKEKVHAAELNFHIENISKNLHQVEKKVEQYSYLPSKIEVIKEEVEKHIATPHVSTDVEKRIEELQEKLKSIIFKKAPKEKLVQKVNKNSHDYIKAMVLSYIRKYGKISGYQLREMVVEEQNITSKSTLYRILEEIEEAEEISTLRQGKEKIFLTNLQKPV